MDPKNSAGVLIQVNGLSKFLSGEFLVLQIEAK